MTEPTVIPEAAEQFSGEDYQRATGRVRAARERLLQADAARAAHDALVSTIGERVERRRASLAQLRKALGLTQAQMADTLGVDQAEVSKMERRLNHKLATLERFVQATGGTLRISAVYGDVEVELNLGELLAETTPTDPPASAPSARPAKTTAKVARVPAKATGASRAPPKGQRSQATQQSRRSQETASLKEQERQGETMSKRAVHVTPRPDGWAVTRDGNKRASSVHGTQKQAEAAGRTTARKEQTEFLLHGKDGRIRAKDSYGHDPSASKG